MVTLQVKQRSDWLEQYLSTYIITIDRQLIHEYHEHYLKQNPKVRTLPFTKPKNEKVMNADGTPQKTKGGNIKTKKKSVNKKDYSIEDCIYSVLSLNDILVINDRLTMNQKKEKWGELGVWIAEKYNLSNLNISNSIVECRIYSETNAQKDNDNIAGGMKFLSDGLFVKSNMYVDDNWKHINPLLIVCDFDKAHPRTEIRITTFDDSLRDVYKKMAIHINNFKN